MTKSIAHEDHKTESTAAERKDHSITAFRTGSINDLIVQKLYEYADMLEVQGANSYRVRAYRRAADIVSGITQPLDSVLACEGQQGLIALPGIGKNIASAIAEIIDTGHWVQLERLHGELTPEAMFQSIPGIGPRLAKKLTEEEHIETLEDLEAVIHQRKNPIKGFGPKRREAIAAVLANRLRRQRGWVKIDTPAPSVAMLLKVDAMYRERASAGTLRKIAPRRFNPTRESWLPVMHASHDQWHFTVLFSNTARAHKYSKTRDWVVIYYQADGSAEGNCTVVTETRGPRAGERVIRGRETESDLNVTPDDEKLPIGS